MEDLSKITCPILIYAGKKDKIISYSDIVSYYESLSKGELFSMERVGYFPFAENPNVFEEKLINWLQQTVRHEEK